MKQTLFLAMGVLFCLAAWGNGWAAPDGSWDAVKAKGKLVIGIDDAFPPMEFRNDKNELVGFDIDASNELGKRLGIKVEHIPTAVGHRDPVAQVQEVRHRLVRHVHHP